jgi:thioredoxin 1
MANDVNDDSFDKKVINASVPTLVDFWAPWCGPCKMLGPIIDELSKEMEGKVNIFKMNIDENPNTPSTYGIRSIPTMMLFKDGKSIGTKVGVLQKSSIKEWIETSLRG